MIEVSTLFGKEGLVYLIVLCSSLLIGLSFSLGLFFSLRYKRIQFSNGLNRMNAVIDRLSYILVFWLIVIAILSILAMVIAVKNFPVVMMIVNSLCTFAFYVLIVIIALLTYQLIMSRGFKILKNQKILDMNNWDYVKGGKLYKWPDATYRYLKKKNWYNDFVLNTNKVTTHLNKSTNLVFVSPSANKGRIEEKLYDLFPKKIDFILMDYIRNIHGKAITKSNGKFTYVDGSFDGNNLKANLANIDIKFVDIIMDIRGCIWYSTDKDDPTGEGIIRIFKEYHKSLNMGGVIIIDAVKISIAAVEFNQLIYKATNYVCGFQEISTHQRIKCFIDEDDFINKHFHVDSIGKGSNRLMTFKKIL